MNLKNPCFQCLNRTETCHGTCEKYKEFRLQKDIENAKIRKLKEKDNITFNPLKQKKQR